MAPPCPEGIVSRSPPVLVRRIPPRPDQREPQWP
uniref:Uncharacterized protein n=1 Tax=Triticum urartu TaxID=4572 RepID=A0A8R7UU16_TRIUA